MPRIEVDGLAELNRAIRHAVDSELPKRIGQANRKIGALVIARLQPAPTPEAVGTGAGATVRPSATKRAVVLAVGGSHRRKPPMSQWGRTPVPSPGGLVPKRPFILETAERHRHDIEAAYLDALRDAMSPAFHDVDL